MSPNQIKLALAGVALAGAAAGGVAAYAVVQHGRPAAVAAEQPVATLPDWAARVSTVAGDGQPGAADGPGKRARFADPFGVARDRAGNLYVADGGDNNSIRKIAPDGSTTTLAGASEGYAEGSGTAAAFNTPSGLALDADGNLYVADTGNNAIRKVTPQGQVSTLAGDGMAGYRDGKGAAARFNGPLALAVAADGAVFVADTYNDRIRRIAPDGTVTTVAGDGVPGMADGPAAQARFDTPGGLAITAGGELLVADMVNNAIRKLGKDGQVSTVAVAPESARAAPLRSPLALAATADGYIYVASARHGRVARITPAGEVAALVDVDHPPQPGYGADGSVRLYGPRGMALAPDGSLFVTDAATFRLHHIAPPQPGQPAPPERGPAPAPSHGATMLWPIKPQQLPHEVVGLMGEVRGNRDGESRDHFHAGLDVQAAPGTPVLAVAAAKVSDPLPNWGYGELSEGFGLADLVYIHMRVGRGAKDGVLDGRFQLIRDEKGKPQRIRIKRGTRFDAGETLGTVNPMAHVHLDYAPNGGALNPLSLPFLGLRDTVPPQIVSIAVLDGAGHPLKDKQGGRLLLPRALGEVGIAVDAFDQMDGNQARRRLGLYKLGYQLLRADGTPVPGYEQPVITQLYDRLPRNREAVKLAYAEASGITVYGSASTRFVYALNNKLINGNATPGTWRVADLAPGDYTLRILAADYAGNLATKGRDLALTVQ
ncbi:MAG TPA: gluconolaconase [Burkholderiaceae bacterium]|nr:gluconolaconase [Burkholderiaceae bacterium]